MHLRKKQLAKDFNPPTKAVVKLVCQSHTKSQRYIDVYIMKNNRPKRALAAVICHTVVLYVKYGYIT